MTYDGWHNEEQINGWPTLRLTEHTDTVRRCVDCRGPATLIIFSGPVFVCAACVEQRRHERSAARRAQIEAHIRGKAVAR